MSNDDELRQEIKDLIQNIEVTSRIALSKSMEDGDPKHHNEFFERHTAAILSLITTHNMQLISRLRELASKKYNEPTQAPDGSIIDEYKLGFNQAIDQINKALDEEEGKL